MLPFQVMSKDLSNVFGDLSHAILRIRYVDINEKTALLRNVCLLFALENVIDSISLHNDAEKFVVIAFESTRLFAKGLMCCSSYVDQFL